MGLINLLNDEVENFKFYVSKGYTGNGVDPGMKSLKFGKDRPGGGDSGQPYIQDPILNNPLPESEDFLLRGGLNAPIDAAQDVVRLTKYMFDLKSPSGLLFVAKQNLLSRIAPKTEASKGIGYAGGALNEGVYTPLSTLAQAGVGFAGIHLNKQGIDPTGLIPGLSINKYEKVAFDNNEASKNKIITSFPIGAVALGNAIASQPLVLGLNPFAQTSNLSNVKNVDQTSDLGIFKNRLLDIWWGKQYNTSKSTDVLSYGGGPNSILGIGKTHIEFAKDGNGAPLRTGINNANLPKDFTTNFGYDNYSVFKNPRPTSWDGARIFNGNTVSGIYQNLTGVDPLEAKYSTTNNSTNLQLFSNSVYKPGTLDPISNINQYQVGDNLKHQTQESDALFRSFPIEDRLIAYKREEISPIVFDTGKVSGNSNTWTATSNQNKIPSYNSTASLAIDPATEAFLTVYNTFASPALKKGNLSNSEIAVILNQSEPNSNKKGYLANLNKNLTVTDMDPSTGIIIVKGHNPIREGGRGIAGDFRQVNRRKRGFLDDDSTYDYISPSGSTYTDYSKVTTLDKIYYSSSSKRKSNPLDTPDDLITFRFGIVNPSNTSDETSLNFRAYIDNFSDSYNADWKSQTYMGRAEKFYKYDSFGRSISLGFTIVADNKTNLGIMYEQLNKLAASLAPTYTTYGYMAGNLHRLTVGNYVVNQVGIMDGLTYEVIEESPWEIDSGNQLPMYIRVTGIKFTPIHDFRPELNWTPNSDKKIIQHQFINQ